MRSAPLAPTKPRSPKANLTDRENSAASSATHVVEAAPKKVAASSIPPAPTSAEAFSCEEAEFMDAMQAYKKSSGRMFPTWSEVLEVLRDLGYQKAASVASGVTQTAETRATVSA